MNMRVPVLSPCLSISVRVYIKPGHAFRAKHPAQPLMLGSLRTRDPKANASTDYPRSDIYIRLFFLHKQPRTRRLFGYLLCKCEPCRIQNKCSSKLLEIMIINLAFSQAVGRLVGFSYRRSASANFTKCCGLRNVKEGHIAKSV